MKGVVEFAITWSFVLKARISQKEQQFLEDILKIFLRT
jgi:hypothetical protein